MIILPCFLTKSFVDRFYIGEVNFAMAASVMSREAAGRIYLEIMRTDGFTIDPVTGENYRGEGYGIAVSDSPELRKADTWFTPRRIQNWWNRKARFLIRDGYYIGGWFNDATDEFTLDISEVIMDRETALREGRERGEEAVYDFAHGVTISCRTGEWL
ncbi:hypothetical protein [Schaalia sp. ZJ1691]|uniref:hypothetical protein n=1 Tax=Schaalia sp. ZJ1691 TaxID=2709404 RepID=UPI0013EE22FA|nr:hypothetical protein [Schaalia sp. ZJ1691]